MFARDPDVGRVLVTGGAGYVGARLVPALLADGYEVTVLDLYLYGRDVLAAHRGPALREVEGDLRDPAAVARALEGCQAVIHLACISNDPSFELDPALGRSINLDALPPLVEAARAAGARRFIYASSSSVYGVKEEEQVTEELPLEPLTDYSRFKAEGERICLAAAGPGFTVTCVRPATVCGYSPRQRLDVIVNLLTGQAWQAGRIRVLGGAQHRPNIHIEDMVDVYRLLLGAPRERVQGRVYNVGHLNHTVADLAAIVRDHAGRPVEVAVEPTNDPRSYRIDSGRIARELGFVAARPIASAVSDLVEALQAGLLPGAPDAPRYWNVKTMKELGLR